MADNTTLTDNEQVKLDIINAVLIKKIKTGQAARILGITSRQVQRLKKEVKREGAQGVVHKLKGKISNNHIDPSVKEKVLQKIRTRYYDFKPGFATEKLKEEYDDRNQLIIPTSQTVRMWMNESGLWKTHKQKKAEYRSWRPRKEYYGELEQFDGSYHYWFENRYKDKSSGLIEVCLLLSVDDATGKITHAEFADNEGVVAVFTFWKSYVTINGKPIAVYLDRYSTYKINHKSAVDNYDLMTQFERAMKDIAIHLITAHSAQAKGRIERLFGTLQDRLVKEMRLAGINTPMEGNQFLKEIFIPKFNNQFSVVPAQTGDTHRSLTSDDKKNFNRTFSIQSKRKVNNDFTIQFKNNWYQLKEVQPTTVRPRETVLIEEWLDGTIHITLKGFELVSMLLPERPKKIKANPVILTTHELNWEPPADHPWRRYGNR